MKKLFTILATSFNELPEMYFRLFLYLK